MCRARSWRLRRVHAARCDLIFSDGLNASHRKMRGVLFLGARGCAENSTTPLRLEVCCRSALQRGSGARRMRRGLVPVPVLRPADARLHAPRDNRSFPAVTHRRSSRAHQTAAHRQGPWLPVRHRFRVSGRSDHPGPSGFSDPGGSCIEACFASRPGHGDHTRVPVATGLLDGAHRLPATSTPRRLSSWRSGVSDVSQDLPHARTRAVCAQVGGGRIDCAFPTGVFV